MESRERSAGKLRRAGRPRPGFTVAVVLGTVVALLAGMATSSPAATTAPSAPRSPSAGPMNGRALVHWSPPASTGGAPIVRYVITPFRGGVAGSPRAFPPTSTTRIFPGLTNGAAYAFRVAAHNAAGAGPRSVLTASIVVGAPAIPKDLQASARPGSALLTWKTPTSNNGAVITGYVVSTIAQRKLVKRQAFNRGATLAVVNGLKNGVGYRFKVRAKNRRGTGIASLPSNIIIPKSTSNARPPASGYFKQLPPGASLPSAASCAARVRHSSWEPRAENRVANQTVPKQPVQLASSFPFTAHWQNNYRPRIKGNYRGTTDEIIQWAACKWGWSDNVVRAQVVIESHWRQSTRGDFEPRSNGHCVFDSSVDPCPTSFGISQVKWYYHPEVNSSAASNSSYPAIRTSTAFNLDVLLAEMRGCYDGLSTYLGNTRGDMWGCLGVWFSGSWHSGSGDNYSQRVQGALADKEWLGYRHDG